MTNQEKIKKVIAVARGLTGAPYKYGAYAMKDERGDMPTEFDCSSFIQFCFNEGAGIDLPRSTILQAASPGQEIANADIQASDVIFYEGDRGHFRHDLFPERKIYIGHAAIYLGDHKIIHATNNSAASGVVEHFISALPNPPYNVVLIKRFII